MEHVNPPPGTRRGGGFAFWIGASLAELCWYRLGEGTLGVQSADPWLRRRFEEIYGQCRVPEPVGTTVRCCVADLPDGAVQVTFEDPEPLDNARFLAAVFPDRRYAPRPAPDGSLRLRLPNANHDVVFEGPVLTAPAGAPWQPLAANLAVSRLLRLQRALLFFHAASLDIRGKGVLICGPKRSGKTTLALALAARGHALLGDEVAAVRLADRSLVPFQRSLALRDGPTGEAADAVLRRADVVMERFPDGEMRRRLPVSAVSEAPVPDRVPLTAVLILRHFSDGTTVHAVPRNAALLRELTPMAVSLWDRPAGALAVRMLSALADASVSAVHAGPPGEAAATIEQLLEES